MPSHHNPTTTLGQTLPLYLTGEKQHIPWAKPTALPSSDTTDLQQNHCASLLLHACGCLFHPHPLPAPADEGYKKVPLCSRLCDAPPAEGCRGSSRMPEGRFQGLLPPRVMQFLLLHPPIPLIILIFKPRLGHIFSLPFLSTPFPGDSSPPPYLSVHRCGNLCAPPFPSNPALLLDSLLPFCSCCPVWAVSQPADAPSSCSPTLPCVLHVWELLLQLQQEPRWVFVQGEDLPVPEHSLALGSGRMNPAVHWDTRRETGKP